MNKNTISEAFKKREYNKKKPTDIQIGFRKRNEIITENNVIIKYTFH